MPSTFTRADIGLRPAAGGPGRLDPAEVEGLALHWPAMSKPLREVDGIKAALRGWQTYHMDGKGWSDIAYQVAVDQAGNRYELRGLATQSGANGDGDVNQRFGAVLLILAPGERPTRRMVRAVRRVVRDHRALFPNSRLIVGHVDIRPEPTACPGPAALAAIRAGRFEPVTWTRGRRVDELIRLTREALPHNSGERLQRLRESLAALLAIPRRRR